MVVSLISRRSNFILSTSAVEDVHWIDFFFFPDGCEIVTSQNMTVSESKQYLDEIWWGRAIDNSASTLRGKKKKRSTIAWPVEKFQSADYSLFPCHSNYGQVVDQHRKSPSIWFHAWNPNIKRFRRMLRMTGKVFPHLSINRVTKIIGYYGSSEHRVNLVRETFSIGCQKNMKSEAERSDSERTTRNQKSSFLITHLRPSSEFCRSVEASSGKPQKGGHDEKWRWRRIRDYIHEVRDFLLLAYRQLHRSFPAPSVSIWEERWRRVRLHSSIDDGSISTSYFAGQRTFISTDIIDGQLKIDVFGSSWRSRGFFWT